MKNMNYLLKQFIADANADGDTLVMIKKAAKKPSFGNCRRALIKKLLNAIDDVSGCIRREIEAEERAEERAEEYGEEDGEED